MVEQKLDQNQKKRGLCKCVDDRIIFRTEIFFYSCLCCVKTRSFDILCHYCGTWRYIYGENAFLDGHFALSSCSFLTLTKHADMAFPTTAMQMTLNYNIFCPVWNPDSNKNLCMPGWHLWMSAHHLKLNLDKTALLSLPGEESPIHVAINRFHY